MNKSISFKTLGCRLNQFEIDALATEFKNAGYRIVGPEADADAYIINTCTVTNQSDVKSRNAINRIMRNHRAAVHVVTGCYVNSHKEELENGGNIAYVIENDKKRNIFSLLDSHFSGEITNPEALEKELFEYTPGTGGFHTRSMIKIQDGCDNYCTFCIIPYVRGRAVSRPVEKVLQNVSEVVAGGAKEIVLTGVNISRYGYDGIDFTGLIGKILEIPGNFRVRISSMEPDGIDERFYRLFGHPKMCPHLHLCLQSGSDGILKKMRRMYGITDFLEIAENLRSDNPMFNITTDIMTGFPGETGENHNETLDIIERVKFSHIHTFKYSVRQGTRAERMDGHIPERIKKRRSEDVRILGDKIKRLYRDSWVGKEQTLLIEQIRNGYAKGYGEYYTPIKVPVGDIGCCARDLKNSFMKVRITGIDDRDDLTLIAETAV